MENFEYITTQDQRFDQIAYSAYGVAKSAYMEMIIQANPNVPIYDKVPGGTVLFIPVIDNNAVKTDAANLPPWKRS